MASFGGEDKKRKFDGSSVAPAALAPEDIRDLLNALNKEQVVDILVKACCAYPDVLTDVRDAASKDPATRKLFVRGLPWETTTEELKSAYEEFGEVDEGAVIIDKFTGKSKGFGFVTFKHIDSAQKALKNPRKEIKGRIVSANLAALGGSQNTTRDSQDVASRKVYVGGLSYDTSNETLLDIFGKYGEIEEGSIATEKGTGKSRGFAFVTYKTAEAAQAACAESVKLIDTRNVNVKLAAEGRQQRMQQEQTSASGLQSYSAGGMGGNQGYGGGFAGPMMNRPMMNQPMGGGMVPQQMGYNNQGGGQFAPMGAGQGFVAPQQFPGQQGQMGGMQAMQQPGQQQFANQGGFAANPVGSAQQFTPQQGGQAGQQAQYGVGQQAFSGQPQFAGQMAQGGAMQQPQGQYAPQASNGQMMGSFQQGVPPVATSGVAGGVPNTMYSGFQGQ